jgi:hypothetical protein
MRAISALALASGLGLWAIAIAAGTALAEDWTPPPGAPAGCQPPPGECFPPPDAPATQPDQPKQPTEPTPAASTTGPGPTAVASSQPTANEPGVTTKETTKPSDAATGGGDSGGGGAPTISINNVALRAGEAVNVPISIDGISATDDPVVTAVVRITGGTGALPGQSGTTLTVGGLSASQTAAVLRQLVITADGTGDVSVSVEAAPDRNPTEGISTRRTLTVLAAAATSTAPTTDVTGAAVAAPTGEPKPEPSARPTAQARGAQITLPAYDPAENPAQTVDTTVTAVALIGAVGLAAGGVAAGVGGAGGVDQRAPSDRPSDSRTSGSPYRREDQTTQMLAPGDSGSFLAIDTNLEGLAAALGSASMRRRVRTWRLPLTESLDRLTAAVFDIATRVSPLSARMVADSTYVRAMFGSASLLLPIAGVVLGAVAVANVNGLAVAPSAALLGAVIFLGCLDALAGFVAVATFAIGIAALGGITDASSIRTLLGLAIVGFGPALIAGASRPMRRPADTYTGWERLGDFVVVPLVGAFAVQGTISALPALSGFQLPIANEAGLLALVALIGLLMRVSMEELAARSYPERIAAVAPPDIPAYRPVRRLVLIAIRTALFGFVAVAFIGNVWQLWVGLALFAGAELCLVLAPRMPNWPPLFHLIPVGVPRFVFIVLTALGLGTVASLLVGDGADLARMSFVLLLIPGLVLAALGMFGRQPKDGDVRWYLRSSMRTVYRAGGVLLLVAAIYLTQFPPTG